MTPLHNDPNPRFDLAGMTALNIARGAAAASADGQPATAMTSPPALTDAMRAWSINPTDPTPLPDQTDAQGGLGVLQKLMDQLDAMLGQLLAGITAPDPGNGTSDGTAPSAPTPARKPLETFLG